MSPCATWGTWLAPRHLEKINQDEALEVGEDVPLLPAERLSLNGIQPESDCAQSDLERKKAVTSHGVWRTLEKRSAAGSKDTVDALKDLKVRAETPHSAERRLFGASTRFERPDSKAISATPVKGCQFLA